MRISKVKELLDKYPTPWKVKNYLGAVDANDVWIINSPTLEIAELIVDAVNFLAEKINQKS